MSVGEGGSDGDGFRARGDWDWDVGGDGFRGTVGGDDADGDWFFRNALNWWLGVDGWGIDFSGDDFRKS